MNGTEQPAHLLPWWDDPRWPMPEPGWDVPPTDIWPDGKVFRYHPSVAVVEWSRAVRVLENLVLVANELQSEPLILALTDAQCRCQRELAGAKEQLEELGGTS